MFTYGVNQDQIGRARPLVWGKYATARINIKTLRDKIPVRLHEHITSMMYTTRRNPKVLCFYDDLKRNIGKQAIGHRLRDVFDRISIPLTLRESNGSIRRILKRAFKIDKGSVVINDPDFLPSDLTTSADYIKPTVNPDNV